MSLPQRARPLSESMPSAQERKTKPKAPNLVLAITTVVKQPLTQITIKPINATITIQTTKITENQELSTHPVRTVAKRTTQRQCCFGANAANKLLLRHRRPIGQSKNQQQDIQDDKIESVLGVAQDLG